MAVSPEALLSSLDKRTPIALLPVRLETRLYLAPDQTRAELRVRIFPDAIHVVNRWNGLTSTEAAAGRHYWQARGARPADAPEVSAPWSHLIDTIGERRALHVVRTLTPTVRPDGTLEFPAVVVDDARSEGAPHVATALPRHWLVATSIDGALVGYTWTREVPAELPLEPGEDGQLPAWLTSFEAAEQVGMAARLVIGDWQPIPGHGNPDIDLFVLGVRDAATPSDGAAMLRDLFAAHEAQGALSLVTAGTATNNTERARAGTPDEGDPARRLLGALSTPVAADTDGGRLGSMLGVPLRCPGHGETADRRAAAMNAALWPTTWGYFLENMLGLGQTPAARAEIAAARRHFIDHVRSRGPLPSIRIGAQPYGVLPVTALHRWQPAFPSESQERRDVVWYLRRRWRAAIAQIPRVARLGTAAQLEAVLRMGPVGRPAWVRHVEGRGTARRSAPELDMVYWHTFDTQFDAARNALLGQVLATVDLTGDRPIANLIFDDLAVDVGVPVVDRAQDAGFLRAIADAPPDEIGAMTAASSLLHKLARHAALLSYGRASDEIQCVWTEPHPFTSTPVYAIDRELVRTGESTVWARMRAKSPSGLSYGEYLHENESIGFVPPALRARARELSEHRRSLRALSPAEPAELERLTAETLDLTSHRLDAWITSIATERAVELRKTVTGTYVGGYGWIEGIQAPSVVRDGSTSRFNLPGDDSGTMDPVGNEGHITAPSVAHAKTAAVLRAGYAAHRSDGPGTSLAINLTSDRVRKARWLLDTVDQGQPFAAVLGYRVERLLNERAPELLATLRQRFALAIPVEGLPELVRGIDGLAVADDLHSRGRENLSAPEQLVYDEIVELVDGTADLLTAEAVHQTVQGRPERARAALEAMETFDRSLPDLDVVRTPVESERVATRVVHLVRPAYIPWPGDDKRARAIAEPRLNGWVAYLLGMPATLTLRARGAGLDREISLVDLDVCALDVVALAGDGSAEPPLFALARHWLRGQGVALDGVTFEAGPTLASALFTARAVHRMFRAARPLGTGDVTAAEVAERPAPAELVQRAASVAAALRPDFDAAAPPERRLLRLAALVGVDALAAPDPMATARAEAARRSAAAEAQPATDPRARVAALVGPDVPVLDAVPWTPLPALPAPEFASSWLHDMARVRPALDALDEVMLLGPEGVGQLRPYSLGDAGQLVLAGHAPTPELYGLVIDSWTEAKATGKATAGVAFHYDVPNARPPQSILLAVPPNVTMSWDLIGLFAAVSNTLELAKFRLVAPPVAAHFLPATLLAENAAADTVSTDLT